MTLITNITFENNMYEILLSALPFTKEDGTIDFKLGYEACKKFPDHVLDPYIDWKFLKKIGLTPEEWLEKFQKGVKEYEDSLQ